MELKHERFTNNFRNDTVMNCNDTPMTVLMKQYSLVTSCEMMNKICSATDGSSMIVKLVSYTCVPFMRSIVSKKWPIIVVIHWLGLIITIRINILKVRKIWLLGHSGYSCRFANDNDRETQLQQRRHASNESNFIQVTKLISLVLLT